MNEFNQINVILLNFTKIQYSYKIYDCADVAGASLLVGFTGLMVEFSQCGHHIG